MRQARSGGRGVVGTGVLRKVRQERFGLFWTGVNGARLGRAGIVVAGEVVLTRCVKARKDGRHGEEGGDWSGLERPVLAGEVRQGSEGKDKVGRVEVRSAG